MSTVQRKRSHPHGCAIDPEQVKEDIVASNDIGESDSDMLSDMFVTMVSINLWCMYYFHLIKLHALSLSFDSILYTPHTYTSAFLLDWDLFNLRHV